MKTKKFAVLLLALALVLCTCACGQSAAEESAAVETETNTVMETGTEESPSDVASETDAEIEAFIAAEGGYNQSIYNATEKYGSVLLTVTEDYAVDGLIAYTVYTDGENAVIDYGDDGLQMLYNGHIYEITTEEEGLCYTLQAFYQEDSIPIEEFVDLGFEFTTKDYDISLVTEEDGSYTWTSTFGCSTDLEEDGYATAVLKLNSDYEITESHTVYYYPDGSVFCDETVSYAFGAEEHEGLAQLTEALDATEGQTRHLCLHMMKDGQVSEESWELDVPVGFYCGLTFSDECYDEEGLAYIYTDEAMTELQGEVDLYADAEYYVKTFD